MVRKIFVLLSLAALATGCKTFSGLIHDDDVVARAGRHKLYRSELEAAIPDNATSEDSLALAAQFIDSWATGVLFEDMARDNLTKEERDLSDELDDYRRTLLRYRYEQKYVSERLDTAVTDSEIEEYYNVHQKDFKLDFPIVQARFLCILKDSPQYDELRKLMSSSEPEKLSRADSIAYSSARKYTDFDGQWVDFRVLAREFGTDYVTLLGQLKYPYVEMVDGDGVVSLAYIEKMQKPESAAPLDYCRNRIRDIILSSRRHALITGLEQELLEDARLNGGLVVFQDGIQDGIQDGKNEIEGTEIDRQR